MALNTIPESSVESYLALWKERVFLNYKRKEITPKDLSVMFQQKDLYNAFFNIMDHDNNGALSEEDWTGSFSKLLGDNDPALVNWFVDKFRNYCNVNDKVYINSDDFGIIVMDLEFGYRFAALIAPKCRKINTIQLITALEMIASLSVDVKWLSWLKYQFTEAVQKEKRLSASECHIKYEDFSKNFNFKEPFLAQRLFNYLDVDKNGYLTLHEFINGLEVVVNGTDEAKMEFLFKVFDIDGDGRIDYAELRMLLKCCLEDSPSLDVEEAVDDLTTALFRNIDIDGSGDITIEELKEAFKKHDGLFRTLSISTSVWIKPKFVSRKKKQHVFHHLKEMISNKRGLAYFWIFYILTNIATTIVAYLNYRDSNGLVICARIFGNGLNFNCALILALVLRKHFTWLRSKGAGSFLPLDHYIELHKIVGIVILIETIIHTIAHLINLVNVCLENKINYWIALFTDQVNLGFPTGIVATILLVIILLFTLSCIRQRGYFQLFYLFHMLSIPWLLILLTHGKQFWKWLLFPAVYYAIEKLLRYRKIRSQKSGDTYICEATVLPSKVTHLVIKRPQKFHYQAGDYIFINIPAIAKYEWHPFSISSIPEYEDHIWLHIRAAGNWTSKLNQFVRTRLEAKYTDDTMLRTSMRSRMSRILSDVSTVPGHIRKINSAKWNIRDSVNINKIHICSSNSNLNNLNNQNLKVNNSLKPINTQNVASVQPTVMIADPYSQNTLQKNLLLKQYSKVSNAKSFNELSVTGNNLEDFPTESTPKSLVTDREQNGSDELTNVTDESSNKKLTDGLPPKASTFKEVAMMNGEELEKYVNSLLEKKCNTNNEHKESKINNKLYDKKPINDAITIEMDAFNTQQQQKVDEIQVKTLESTVIHLQTKQNNDCEANKNGSNEENDVLGYLKMYKKANRLCIQQMPSNEQWCLQVYIDGPYGTTSRDIFDAEHVVLIAAGIGITPYASILQAIMQQFKKMKNICPKCDYSWETDAISTNKFKIKKVDFIWVTREQRSLEWFISMLSQMEIDQKKNNQNFLETHLYVTSARRQADLKSIGLHMTLDVIYSDEDARLIEGLKQRTHYGRPNWDVVLQQLIRKQEGKISVFFCGPPSLNDVLQEKCKQYNLTYKKELF